MAEKNAKRPVRGTPRWVKLVLGASLALNLLFVGLAVGTFWRVSKTGGPPQMRNGFAFVTSLEREDRRAVLRELRRAGRGVHEAGRADTQRILVMLRADTLDAVALQDAISRQIETGAGFQTRISSEWMSRVAEMDLAARQAYADRVEEKLKRGPRKSDRRRPKE